MNKTLLLIAALALAGCNTTEEQRIQRGKNVAKLEKRAWSVGGFLANLAGNIIVNTATNYVNEKFTHSDERAERQLRGFQK